jgi:hypothetical protein
MTQDVFISYSSKDKDIADKICAAIEETGINCWIAPRNVMGGENYAKQIVTAITKCSVMLFVFSEWSNKSDHVENEIDIAFNKGKTIVPFKISDSEMSDELQYYLRKKHWIDGTPEPLKSFDKLVEQITLSIPQRAKKVRTEEFFDDLDKLLEEYKENSSELVRKRFINIILNSKGFDKILSEMNDADNHTNNKKSKSAVSSAGRYDIMQNKDGEILIIIKIISGGPEEPRFVYDGGNEALLYRSRENSIMLKNIANKARKPLLSVDNVLLVELDGEEVAREYNVPVRQVKSLADLMKD